MIEPHDLEPPRTRTPTYGVGCLAIVLGLLIGPLFGALTGRIVGRNDMDRYWCAWIFGAAGAVSGFIATLIGIAIGRPVHAMVGIGGLWLVYIVWWVAASWGGNWGIQEVGMLALWIALAISGTIAGGLGAMSRWLGKVK